MSCADAQAVHRCRGSRIASPAGVVHLVAEGYVNEASGRKRHERVRLRPVRHRRRLGRGAGGAHRRRPRRQGGHRRGVPLRRHLRDPRLRAQEAAGLRQPLPRRVRGRGGLRLEPAQERTLRLADPDRQQGRRDRAPRRPLPRRPGAGRRQPSCRPAPSWPTRTRCVVQPGGRKVTAKHHPGRHRRPPGRARRARRRPRHHLQRGVPSAKRCRSRS